MSPDAQEREAQVVHAIERWHRPAELAEFAFDGHGFGDSDSGFGVIYASDLDEYEVARQPIPAGFVEVYGFWGVAKGGFEFVIEEREYLRILARTLRTKGLLTEASTVESLIR